MRSCPARGQIAARDRAEDTERECCVRGRSAGRGLWSHGPARRTRARRTSDDAAADDRSGPAMVGPRRRTHSISSSLERGATKIRSDSCWKAAPSWGWLTLKRLTRTPRTRSTPSPSSFFHVRASRAAVVRTSTSCRALSRSASSRHACSAPDEMSPPYRGETNANLMRWPLSALLRPWRGRPAGRPRHQLAGAQRAPAPGQPSRHGLHPMRRRCSRQSREHVQILSLDDRPAVVAVEVVAPVATERACQARVVRGFDP